MESQTALHKDDVYSDVTAAFGEIESNTPPAPRPEPEPAEDNAPEGDENPQPLKARDDKTGKFAKKDIKAEPDPAAEPPPAKGAKGAEPLEQWPAEVKEAWKKLPPDMQKFVTDTYNGIQKSYTGKFQAVEDDRKLATQFRETANPYMAMLQSENSDPLKGFQSFLAHAYTMRHGRPEQKAQLLRGLAAQYGVDLNTQQSVQPQTTPEIAALQKQIEDLRTSTQSQSEYLKQASEAQQKAEINHLFEEYEQATDTGGKPLYPHFASVYEQIGLLVGPLRAQNPNLDNRALLKEAYQKAIWLNDTVRTSMQDDQRRNASAVQQAQKAAVAAGASVRGSPNGATPLKKTAKAHDDPRNDIAALWDSLSEGNA